MKYSYNLRLLRNQGFLFWFTVVVMCLVLGFVVWGCGGKDNESPESECPEPEVIVQHTYLKISNQSSSVLDLIFWAKGSDAQFWFNPDMVWDDVLGDYCPGMDIGSSYKQEVVAGTGPVYFFFAAGGPQCWTNPIIVSAGKENTFTFTDSTVIYTLTSGPLSSKGMGKDTPYERTFYLEKYKEDTSQ